MKHQRDIEAGARHTSRRMNARKRLLLLTLIMVTACVIVLVIMMLMLYRSEIGERREMLKVSVQSQARLIESVARYDASIADLIRDERPDYNASARTLGQIIDAHEQYRGFHETERDHGLVLQSLARLLARCGCGTSTGLGFLFVFLRNQDCDVLLDELQRNRCFGGKGL